MNQCACVSEERGDGNEEGVVLKLSSEKRVSTGDDVRESELCTYDVVCSQKEYWKWKNLVPFRQGKIIQF